MAVLLLSLLDRGMLRFLSRSCRTLARNFIQNFMVTHQIVNLDENLTLSSPLHLLNPILDCLTQFFFIA